METGLVQTFYRPKCIKFEIWSISCWKGFMVTAFLLFSHFSLKNHYFSSFFWVKFWECKRQIWEWKVVEMYEMSKLAKSWGPFLDNILFVTWYNIMFWHIMWHDSFSFYNNVRNVLSPIQVLSFPHIININVGDIISQNIFI